MFQWDNDPADGFMRRFQIGPHPDRCGFFGDLKLRHSLRSQVFAAFLHAMLQLYRNLP
jgi:hypothetical protein